MKIRLWPKKRRYRALLLLLAVLLVPYVFSRLASPWRCLTVYAMPGAGEHESSMPLRVACYNIAHGRGVAESNWDGGDRAERIARLDQISELLREMDADVLVLNEVDFDSSWSYSLNQAQYLAEKAGYPYVVEQRDVDVRIVLWKWRFGNAVLSKYPITDAQVVDLPGYSTWETVLAGKKRSITCDISVGEQVVHIIGAHLSYRSESVRVRSTALFVDIATKSKFPTIVAGDLNSTPPGFPQSASDSNGNNAIETLDNSGYFRRSPDNVPFADEELTFHSVEPSRVIDWIMIPQNWEFLQYTVEQSQLSDHRPVVSDVAPAP